MSGPWPYRPMSENPCRRRISGNFHGRGLAREWFGWIPDGSLDAFLFLNGLGWALGVLAETGILCPGYVYGVVAPGG